MKSRDKKFFEISFVISSDVNQSLTDNNFPSSAPLYFFAVLVYTGY